MPDRVAPDACPALAMAAVLLLGAVHPAAVAAPPLEAVYDSGSTVPIAPYLAVPGNNPDNRDGVVHRPNFPLTSTLVRGVLPKEVPVFDARWLTQALVVTGTDRHSMAWLLLHQAQLEALGAKVLVVQAMTPQHLALAQSLVPQLPMWPRDGGWIEEQLRAAGAAVYPILIGTDGIARQILPVVPAVPSTLGGEAR